MFEIDGGICAVEGVEASGVKEEGSGLALIRARGLCTGMFTKNRFMAPPLIVCKEKLGKTGGKFSGIVISSGNANSYTGSEGIEDAREMARFAAECMGIPEDETLVSSTGIIGRRLDMKLIKRQIEKVAQTLEHGKEGAHRAAEAILTTDREKKEVAVEVGEGKNRVVVGGMAKGAGMVYPNMATMLAFIFTDAPLSPSTLKECLKQSVDKSFHMLTIDGDMSTNDMVLLTTVSNRREDIPQVKENFTKGLEYVCVELAKMMAKGAEGATTLITVEVRGASSLEDARKSARTIANSTLLKTAVYGRDPNWGRIVAALGYSGARASPDTLSIAIADVWVVKSGEIQNFDYEELKKKMDCDEVKITVDLGCGKYSAVAWGCDLSEEYVRINSEFST